MRVDGQDYRGVQQQGEVDWASLGRALWRKKWLIVIPALIVGMLAAVAVSFITPRYKSEARILIESRENAFLRPDVEKSEGTQVDPETVASQVQILTSRDLAKQVIQELKLAEKPEFDPVLRGLSLPSTILSLFGIGKDPLRTSPEERALSAYFARLNVQAIEKSRVISVEFQSSDRELAAQVANTIADVYMTMQQTAKREQTRGASQWLSVEIDKLRPRVAEAEKKVEDFRAKSDLLTGTNNSSLGGQQLSELTAQLSTARAQKAELDAKARLIGDMLKSRKPVEASDITNAELLRRLIEQRATVRAQLAEQSSTLLELHPRIQELRAQVAALDTQIRGELEKTVRSIENDARIAGARVETLVATIDRVKKQVAVSGDEDVQLRALEREAKSQRDLLESYLARYREAMARDSIAAAPADSRIISRASPANEVAFPKKTPIVLISTLATLFIAATLVIAGELMGDGTAPRPTERVARSSSVLSRFDMFKRKTPVPPAKAAAAASATGAMTQVSDLAKALVQAGEQGKRVALIGAAHNVGTTHTAIELARALLRQENKRVVLVDLAFSAPNLSVLSTKPGAPGLAELARGQASFGDIITRDQFSRLHLIATGKIGGEGHAILSSPRLIMAMEGLARAYDHVVIDAGAATDSELGCIAVLVPRGVLVVNDASEAAIKTARERLSGLGFADIKVFLASGKPAEKTAAA